MLKKTAEKLARSTIKMNFIEAVTKIFKDALIEMLQASFPDGMASEFFSLLKEGREGVVTSKGSCGCVAKVEHRPSETTWVLTVNYANCQGFKRWKKKK